MKKRCVSVDKTTLQSIKETYGIRATDSCMERKLYSRDLAPVPELLVKPLFQTVPDIIVRPAMTSEVSDLMKQAFALNIPVTPRAGATTVFFNAVPVRGGMLMDLNLLQGVVSLNEETMTVIVRAATTWEDIEDYLNERNYACKSMPSSAPAATVGGWLCMMGYGIGSLKYGSLMSQVKALEVVLPDGSVQNISRETVPSIEALAASEGTLGIVTEIELEIRPKTAMKHFLLHVPDIQKALLVMQKLMGLNPIPYNMHFSDAYFMSAIKALGFSHLDTDSGCLVAVDYEGAVADLSLTEDYINTLVTSEKSLHLLPEHLANEEWQERFRSIRLKRGGPSVLGGELWLPLAKLPNYLIEIEKMSKQYGDTFMTYGHVVSPKHATVMTMFYSDETKLLRYLLDLSIVKKIQDAGYRHGGYPYGVGLWNMPYIRRIHSRAKLKKISELKRKLDPQDIMNPGKIYQPPIVLKPFLFNVGMEVAAIVRRIFRKGR